MARFGGADEIIICDIQSVPDWLPFVDDQVVAPLLRCGVVSGSGVEDFLTVFICAGQKPDVLPALTVPASEDIASDSRVCMSDMWRVVDVINRRRYIESLVVTSAHP